MPTIQYTTVSESGLRRFVTEVFLSKGFSEEHAILSADVLLLADLRGIDSHGVARLSGYLRLIDAGRINPTPKFSIERRKKTIANLNADGSIGLISAPFAMDLAIEMSAEYGSGWMGIKHSNHFGIAAYHAMKALDNKMIGFSMTNASPLVTTANGSERMLGTNPICIAVPAGKEPAFVLDMATSAAANGKLEIAERTDKPIPNGWILGKDGRMDTKPDGLKRGGMLLPLGSDNEHGIHKGYGLGAWVDIFSGVLTGANYGPWVPPFVSFLQPLPNLPGQGLGHFVGCWEVDGFREYEDFCANMDQWIQRFKATIPLNPSQPVIIPGTPEREEHVRRLESGIPLVEAVMKDLEGLAQNTGVSFDL
ncbi:MAG: Ldh family oxidoreductase [Bacteroidota bacterium]|jgi:LDH2 family malate/lactate/ureidoglycolate dehydrogenase